MNKQQPLFNHQEQTLLDIDNIICVPCSLDLNPLDSLSDMFYEQFGDDFILLIGSLDTKNLIYSFYAYDYYGNIWDELLQLKQTIDIVKKYNLQNGIHGVLIKLRTTEDANLAKILFGTV